MLWRHPSSAPPGEEILRHARRDFVDSGLEEIAAFFLVEPPEHLAPRPAGDWSWARPWWCSSSAPYTGTMPCHPNRPAGVSGHRLNSRPTYSSGEKIIFTASELVIQLRRPATTGMVQYATQLARNLV